MPKLVIRLVDLIVAAIAGILDLARLALNGTAKKVNRGCYTCPAFRFR